MIKLAGAFFKRPDQSREQCLDHYRDGHGPVVKGSPDFANQTTRYDQHPRLDWSAEMSPAEDDICGVTQLWYESIGHFQRAFSSEVYDQKIRPDEHRFVDLSRSLVIIGRENQIFGDARDAPVRLFRFVKFEQGSEQACQAYLARYGDSLAKADLGSARPDAYVQTDALDSADSPFGDAPVYDMLEEYRFGDIATLPEFISKNRTVTEHAARGGAPAYASSAQLLTGFRRVIGHADRKAA